MVTKVPDSTAAAATWLEQNTQPNTADRRRLAGLTAEQARDHKPDLTDVQRSSFVRLGEKGWVQVLSAVDSVTAHELLGALPPKKRDALLRRGVDCAAKSLDRSENPDFVVNWKGLRLSEPRPGLQPPDKALRHAAAVLAQGVYAPFPENAGLVARIGNETTRHNIIEPGTSMAALRAAEGGELDLSPVCQELLAAGYTLHFVTGAREGPLCKKAGESTQVMVAVCDDKALVTWRGTEINSALDILTDANFVMKDFGDGKAHSGFVDAYSEVRDTVRGILSRNAERVAKDSRGATLKVGHFGHSLGGALSKVGAADTVNIPNTTHVAVIPTEGADVWNESTSLGFAIDGLARTTWPWRNWNDVVTHVPPRGAHAIRGEGGDVNLSLPFIGRTALSFGHRHPDLDVFTSDGIPLYVGPRGNLRPGFDPSTPIPGWVNDKDGADGLGEFSRKTALESHGPIGAVTMTFANRDVEVDPVAAAALLITGLCTTHKHDLDRRVYAYEARAAMRVFVHATPEQIGQICQRIPPDAAAAILKHLPAHSVYRGEVTSKNGNTWDFAPVIRGLEAQAGAAPDLELQTEINAIEEAIPTHLVSGVRSAGNDIAKGLGLAAHALKSDSKHVDAALDRLFAAPQSRKAIVDGLQADAVVSLLKTASLEQLETRADQFAMLRERRPGAFAAWRIESLLFPSAKVPTADDRKAANQLFLQLAPEQRNEVFLVLPNDVRRALVASQDNEAMVAFATQVRSSPQIARFATRVAIEGLATPSLKPWRWEPLVTSDDVRHAFELLEGLSVAERDQLYYFTDRAVLQRLVDDRGALNAEHEQIASEIEAYLPRAVGDETFPAR